jgi:cytochrome P450
MHAALAADAGVVSEGLPGRSFARHMLSVDPPDHTRLRRLVARDFTPTAIARWRPAIERFVGAALDRMLDGDATDLVDELAAPLPIQVIAEIIGVSPGDYPDFKRWSDGIVEGFKLGDSPEADEAAVLGILQVSGELNTYVQTGAAERRNAPRDDLFSQLLQPRDGETLSEPELFWFFLLLLVAGNETTTNLLGNLAVALLDHPDQWNLLREHPELVPSAVEEALRFGSPIQGFFRTALSTVEVADTEIPEGGRVLLLFAAANRDPRQYDGPAAFDISRNPVDHVGFGSGIHSCLGAALARLETAVVLEQLGARVGTIEPAGSLVRTANPTLRGVTSLPVRVLPR